MMVRFLQILVVLLLGWGFWQLCRPRPTFAIRLKQGVAQATRGHVTAAFLRDIQETCRALGVTDGVIQGKPRGDRIGLEFSGSIPPICQQRLRNLWANSRDSERRLV